MKPNYTLDSVTERGVFVATLASFRLEAYVIGFYVKSHFT